jgi:hypothetical protein
MFQNLIQFSSSWNNVMGHQCWKTDVHINIYHVSFSKKNEWSKRHSSVNPSQHVKTHWNCTLNIKQIENKFGAACAPNCVSPYKIWLNHALEKHKYESNSSVKVVAYMNRSHLKDDRAIYYYEHCDLNSTSNIALLDNQFNVIRLLSCITRHSFLTYIGINSSKINKFINFR